MPLTLISEIPRILAGNKNGLPRLAPQAAGRVEDEAGARWFLCAAARASSAPIGRATTEAGPIMDGGECVALAISKIRLALSGAARHGHRKTAAVRSVGGA